MARQGSGLKALRGHSPPPPPTSNIRFAVSCQHSYVTQLFSGVPVKSYLPLVLACICDTTLLEASVLAEPNEMQPLVLIPDPSLSITLT